MNITFQSPEVILGMKEDLVEKFNTELDAFARRSKAVWSIAKLDNNGLIRVASFSNNTMLPTLILLTTLCYEYPLVFDFQVNDDYEQVTAATKDSCAVVKKSGKLPHIGFWILRGKLSEAIELIKRAQINQQGV